VSQQSTALSRDERAGTGVGRSQSRRPARPVPGSWEDRSIAGFCRRHGWSRSTFENNRDRGTGPRELRTLPRGRVTITEQSEREFDAKYTE
jgi:hypothetical protein